LIQADLLKANLADADLTGADVRGAGLMGAHLRCAHLSAASAAVARSLIVDLARLCSSGSERGFGQRSEKIKALEKSTGRSSLAVSGCCHA
jgi:hypothetical protein